MTASPIPESVLEDDLRFSGRHDVVVIDGKREFAAHPTDNPYLTVYMAGLCLDSVDMSRIGPDDVADLYGQFILMFVDRSANTISICSDRYGHLPFYMAHKGQSVYLSTSLASLMRRGIINGALDFAAMSEICAFNVALDQSTPLKGTTAFAAGSEVTLNLDTLDLRSRKLWDPAILLRNAATPLDSVLDRLIDLFLEGVAITVSGQDSVAVTLSGGVDSRCLLAASLATGKKTVTYSTGVPGSRAERYAKHMAGICGVPHHSYPLDSEFVARMPDLLRDTVRRMDGMSYSSEVEASWLRDHMGDEPVLLHGAFAELYKIGKMHGFHYGKDDARRSRADLAAHLWERFSKRHEMRRAGFSRHMQESIGDVARERLNARIGQLCSGLSNAAVLQMLYLDTFLGKVAKFSRHVWSARVPTHFPFAYPPLVDLILQVRPQDKVENRFAAKLLKRLSPKLARFPDSNTGAPIGASRIRRHAIHAVDWAKSRILGRKTRADHQDFADWLARTHPTIEARLASIQADGPFYDLGQVDRLAASCRSGDDLAARTLQFLWAWGLWRTERARP